jgi:hypothetical protein
MKTIHRDGNDEPLCDRLECQYREVDGICYWEEGPSSCNELKPHIAKRKDVSRRHKQECTVIYHAISMLATLCAADEKAIIKRLTGFLWDEDEAKMIKSNGKPLKSTS